MGRGREREREKEREGESEKNTAQKSAMLPRAARVPLAADVATNIRKWAEGSVREGSIQGAGEGVQMLKCWLKVCPACRKFVSEMKLTICSVFRLKMALSGRRGKGGRGEKVSGLKLLACWSRSNNKGKEKNMRRLISLQHRIDWKILCKQYRGGMKLS